MDRNKLLRSIATALTAALMAACAAHLIVRALGFHFSWLGVYLTAGAAAALVQTARRGTAWAIGAAALLFVGLGALIWVYIRDIAAAVRALSALKAEEVILQYASVGQGLALILALLMGALFASLLHSPGSAPFALVLLLASIICALAVNEDLSLWMALPGLAAGVVAFGLPSDARQEGVRPMLLLPAVALVLFALVLTPAGRTTWAPLENLANRIRAVVDDYIRFTEERVAFSINEKGYDHAGMVGDNVVAMLGGPANPSEDVVMRVDTEVNLLLRGTIKRSYTGYSWIDDQAKARYLYYDFTHRGVRNDIFDAKTSEGSAGFISRSAAVEILEEGTSTLFVPAQLSSFDMNLADAVYYNSAGEIFLTREVAPGDEYSFSARIPRGESELIAAAGETMGESDPGLSDARSQYMELPQGIDNRVYALAVELTQNSSNPAEKAYAIQNYLAQNYHYTLKGSYPEAGQDFVSWFLLESREGYCSYFASAMAVMCRIAGLPARYVEGYFVQAQPGGESIVTGKNAHAWVEVYLNGLGWVAFDPTARSLEAHGMAGEGALEQGHEATGDDEVDGDGVSGESAEGETDDDGQEAPPESDDGEGSPDEGDEDGSPDEGDGDGDGTSDEGDGNDNTHPDEGDGEGDYDGLDNPDDGPTPTPDPGDDNQDLENPPEEEETPEPPEDEEDPPEDTPPEDNPPEDNPPEDNPPEDNPNQSEDDSDSLTWLWILLGALLLLAFIGISALWLRRRLAATDPVLLAQTVGPNKAALILYRAILTLLAILGLAPMNGESPSAFAQRVTLSLPNPDYERFVSAVAQSRYGGRGLPKEAVETGLRAYQGFLISLRRGEKLRFTLRRVLNGLGDFENIP